MLKKVLFILFLFSILSFLFPQSTSFLLLFFLVFVDKVIFGLLQFPGMVGIELTTLSLILVTLAFGYFPGVFLLIFLIYPIFDVIKMIFFGGDPPNLLGIIVDGSIWCLIPLVLLALKNFSFLVGGMITVFSKNLIFILKDKLFGESLNPIPFVGNLLFYYFLLLFAQQKLLPLFGIF